jgi:hypothetical protein
MPKERPSWLAEHLGTYNPYDPGLSGRQAMLSSMLLGGIPAAAVGAGVGALASRKGRRRRGAALGAMTGLLGAGGWGLYNRHQARGQAEELSRHALSEFGQLIHEGQGIEAPGAEYRRNADPDRSDLRQLRALYAEAQKQVENEGLNRASQNRFARDNYAITGGGARTRELGAKAMLGAGRDPINPSYQARVSAARQSHFLENLRSQRVPHDQLTPTLLTDLMEGAFDRTAPHYQAEPTVEAGRHLLRTYAQGYTPPRFKP